MKKALITAALVALTSPALAQSNAGTAPPEGGAAGATSATSAAPLRFGRDKEYSVGFRSWMFIIPGWIPGLFAYSEPGWSGVLTPAIGPEFVYRRGNLDVVVGIQYTGLQAADGFFHGSNEGEQATERVKSSLWGLYANALFLWNVRPTDWFEFQYGAGLGLGYIGGDLYRVQVFRNGGSGPFLDCAGPGSPGAVAPTGVRYCDSANNHYGSYTEPSVFDGGSLPRVLPWISLPHLAMHFRPHRNVDIRVDGGFALIGFYTGIAAHYVF